MLDGMNAFRIIRKEPLAQTLIDVTETFLAEATEVQLADIQKQRKALEELCLKQNVSLNGFLEVARLAEEIAVRLGERHKGIRFDARDQDDKYDAERYGELQRCILSAHANRVFIQENGGLRDLLRDYDDQRNNVGQPYNGYELARGSIVLKPRDGALLVGNLREVQTNKQDGLPPLVVLTDVTSIPVDVFVAWAAGRADAHNAVLNHALLSGNVLTAKYADKAPFEVVVLPASRNLALRLAD
jgi:hypothetical protein